MGEATYKKDNMKETRSNEASCGPGAGDRDDEEILSLAAQGQKTVIYAIVLNLLFRAAERGQLLTGLFADVVFICVAGYTLLGVARICSGLGKSQNQKIGWMVLSFLPLISLIALVYLNVKATRMLRNAGWQIGLLGARQ